MGLRRAAAIGLVLAALSYLVVPFAGPSLSFALGALFLVFVTVEFSVVSAMSLSTEVLPDVRATMMSGFLAAASLGRVSGALLGGPVWIAGGIRAVVVVSFFISSLALLIFYAGLRGRRGLG